MRRARYALVAVLLLTLAACDSGEPEAPSLIGTWSLESTTGEFYVTVREAQLFPDIDLPTVGSIAFSGAATGSLSQGGEYVGPNAQRLALRTVGQPTGSQTVRFAQLLLDASGALLAAERPDGTLTAYRATAVPPFTYDYRTGMATVPALTLTSDAGGVVSVATGSVRFQGAALPANVETLAKARAIPRYDLPGSDVLGDQIEFTANHSFHAVETYPDGTRLVTDGTWETAGGEVQLTVTDPDRAGTNRFDYAIQDGRLRLSEPLRPFCVGEPDPAGCLLYAEGSDGLKPGTLTRVASTRVATFSRAPAMPS